jgi:hypothetical protein
VCRREMTRGNASAASTRSQLRGDIALLGDNPAFPPPWVTEAAGTCHTRSVLWAPTMLFTLSVHVPGLGLVPVGAVLALVRWREIHRATAELWSSSARSLLPCAGAALAVGVLLRIALVGSGDGTLRGSLTAVEVAIWIVAFPLLGLGGFLAFSQLGMYRGLWWVTLGALVGNIAYFGVPALNPWKYVLSYPVSLLVLMLAARARGRLGPILACAVLVAVSVAFDSRSVAGAAALTGIFVTVFGSRSPQASSRSSERWRLATIAAVSVAALLVLLNAMRLGWLGATLASQYAQQTTGGRNILLGGRVELNATSVLLDARPQGFGLGASPSLGLQADAIRAVAAAGGDPNRDYYNFAVFGDRVDLHSIIADLWFHAGMGGVALTAVMVAVLLRGVIAMSSGPWPAGLRAAAYFAISQACWDLPFSPMAQIDHVVIGLAVALTASASARPRSRRRGRYTRGRGDVEEVRWNGPQDCAETGGNTTRTETRAGETGDGPTRARLSDA